MEIDSSSNLKITTNSCFIEFIKQAFFKLLFENYYSLCIVSDWFQFQGKFKLKQCLKESIERFFFPKKKFLL